MHHGRFGMRKCVVPAVFDVNSIRAALGAHGDERSVFALGDGEDVRTHAVHDVAFQIAHKSNFSALPCVIHTLGKYSFIPSAEPSYRHEIATKSPQARNAFRR